MECIEGIFIGRCDLSASLRSPGAAPEREALKSAPERILSAGRVPGILSTRAEAAVKYLSWVYRFVAVSVDIGVLIRGAREDREGLGRARRIEYLPLQG